METIGVKDLEERHLKYKAVFESPVGVDILADLRRVCNADRTTIQTSNHIDPYDVLRREGRREVFLYIEKMIADLPEEIVKLLEE